MPFVNKKKSSGFYPQNEQKKKSGAKLTMIKDGPNEGMYSVHAWNASKERGLITAKGFQSRKSVSYSNKQGEESSSILLNIFYKRTGASFRELCWLKHNTGKIYVPTLGMVISTKAPNGGYFGKQK